MSTGYALERAARDGVEAVGVQHHYAHALSCLAEAGVDPRSGSVQAVVFDGTGYGSDGRIWGGEWLLVHEAGFERLRHLQYMPLAGGEAGIEHVDRLAAGYLLAAGDGELLRSLPAFAHMGASELELRQNEFCLGVRASLAAPTAVPCSSMGRLFDVVAGMLGLAQAVTYEAQAAIRLETLARRAENGDAGGKYHYGIGPDGSVDIVPLLREVAGDILDKVESKQVALRFHRTIAGMVAEVCMALAGETGARRVALSGGCFQNALLTELCLRALTAGGLTPIIHSRVPCNDGGVALGQAVAARLRPVV
jgi:hydrogenase maturation protein HypF